MRSASAAPSRRGSLDRNGSLEEEQRMRTSRPRLSFLARVDEAFEDGGATSENADDHAMRSASAHAPAFLSSDEEIENFQRQSARAAGNVGRCRGGVAYKGSYRQTDVATTPRTQRMSVVSRRSSSRPPLQSVSREVGRSRRESHIYMNGDVISTTLNEKKQKKLVALFFWRRRTLETYLSAWKWAVFDAMPSGGQAQSQYELTRLRQYSPAPVRPMRMFESVPHHQSALLLNTMRRQRRDSMGSIDRPSNHRDRMDSLREEYRQLKASALKQQQTSNSVRNDASHEQDDAAAIRVAFRVRLRVYYVYFDAWREFVKERRADRSQLDEQALRHFKKRQLRKLFYTWAKPYLVVQRDEKRRLLHVCEKGNQLVKRRRFRLWMQFHRRCQLVHQQTLGVMRVRMAHIVSRWHDWMVRTIHLRHAASRRRLILLRRYLSRLQAYRIRRRRKKSVRDSAVALSERISLRRVWSQWHRKVFVDEASSCMNATSYVLAKKSAVTRWKRFVARRRERQMRAEQADCRLYEGLLRRFWGRWCSYLVVRSEERGVFSRALHHWASHHKRRAVRALLSVRCERKYEHDRIQGAKDFFHRQIASKALVKWRDQSIRTRRSRHFRLVRLRRQYVLAFVAWRQYAKQSRHNSERGDMLWLRTRSRMLRRSMQLWLYRHKLRAAFQILDSRYAARLLEKHTKAWRSMVLHRRRWRDIFRRFCTTREVAVRRRVFAVWRRLVVSSRCRRRLVRLFQKKHLCKKLRSCVQALASNATLQRLQRAANARRLAGVWHAWVTFRSDQQNRRDSTVAATQFYVARRYSVTLHRWKENARDWVRSRQTNARAIRYLIYSMMRKSLYAWYKRCQVWGRRRKLVEMRITKIERSRLRKFFCRWNSAARTMCRARHELHKVWCRAMLRRRERVFFLWRALTRQRKVLRQLVRDQQCRTIRRRGRDILRTWRVTTFHLKKRRQAAREVASHWRERTLTRVLHVWRVVAAGMYRDRMNTIKAASFYREFLLLRAFYGWQHAALEKQVLREKQDRVMKLIARKRLHRAITSWKRKRVLRHIDKAKLIQAAAFYRKRRRLRGIEAWSEFIGRRRDRYEAVKRALIFAASKLKRRTFGAWLRHSAGTRVFKLKLRLIFQTGEDSIQRRAFRCWRRYKRAETLANRANRWRRRFLQRLVWRHWRQQVTFSRKMRANVLITNRLLQNNVARTSFTRWKRFVQIQQQLAQAIADAEKFYHARCYRLAFRQFRHAVRHARAVELSTTFHAAHMQRQQFMNWRRAVIVQKEWEAQKVSVVKRYRVLRLNAAFSGWRQVVQTKQRALEAKADRHSNALALKHAWKIWTRTVLCQHIAYQFADRRIRRDLLVSFRDWTQFVQEQQLIRSHVDAAVAHVDRVIKQKIWERWMEFLDERHAYHRLEDVASSFYTTSVLMRRTFTALSSHRTQRRSERAQQLQADDLCMTTTLRKCFDRWDAYITYRHSREATKITENDTIRRMVTSRAVWKWHKRVSVLRSLASAENRAKTLFLRRAETGVIRRLREHAITKIETRKGRAHAVTFRASHLTLVFFTRWKNFLAWRRHHRHLLRLFRANQQHDYFALWCKYVARNRRKRELQATATRGYRNLVQRSAFIHWHERCDYWCAKRRAILWHRQRLTQSVLEVWAHRVRVLRKMRHMFRFQDSFRLETHFATWKRYWWWKKQQIARVQDAAVWFKKHRKEKCFAMWLRWVEVRLQEKNTLRMAIGFRTRFFSRKYLHAWRLVVERTQRKTWLEEEAQRRFQRKLYVRVFGKLRAFAKLRRRLTEISAVLTETLTEMRIQRSVHTWCDRLRQIRQRRELEISASLHYRHIATRRVWIHLQAWHAVRRVKQGKLRRAQHFCERGVCRRALMAWVVDVRNKHRLHIGLQRFKDRYFRGVADDCFLRWLKFVRFKRRLRLLKHRVDRSRQQRALQAWRMRAHNSRKRLDAHATIQALCHRALLQRCVVHWESFATDCWIHQHLVRAALRRRERRAKSCALMRWKALLPLRRARQEWRQRACVRHKTLLIAVLRQWRWLTVERDSDAGSSSDA